MPKVASKRLVEPTFQARKPCMTRRLTEECRKRINVIAALSGVPVPVTRFFVGLGKILHFARGVVILHQLASQAARIGGKRCLSGRTGRGDPDWLPRRTRGYDFATCKADELERATEPGGVILQRVYFYANVERNLNP